MLLVTASRQLSFDDAHEIAYGGNSVSFMLFGKPQVMGDYYYSKHESRSFFHELNWCQDVRLAGLHDAPIHHHLFQHEVRLLEMEHDVELTLARVIKERGRFDLLLGTGEALAHDLALEGAAFVEGEVLRVVLRQPRLSLLVHQQHKPDPHGVHPLLVALLDDLPPQHTSLPPRSRTTLSFELLFETRFGCERNVLWWTSVTGPHACLSPVSFKTRAYSCAAGSWSPWRCSINNKTSETALEGRAAKPTAHWRWKRDRMNPGGRGQNVGLGMRSLAKTVVKVDAFREDPSLQGVADSMGRRLTLVPSIAFLLLLMPFFAGVRDAILDVHCNGSKVGVCYGRNADDLPTPDKVAQLIQLHSIKYVRIYDSNIQVIKAFANTGVELMVGVPNSDLLPFSQYQSNVDTWLKNSILPYYPATMITYITVGAEVTEIKDNVSALVVPAMVNVLTALKKVGLHKRIKVSSTHSLGILSRSFPPSAGALDSKYAFFLKPMLEFLVENNSPFMVDLYPYYAYRESPSNVSLDYALFSSSAVDVIDPNTGLVYTNMFDAQLDSIFFALMALNFRTLKIMVTESGWPNKGAAKETAATPDNAQTYNTNLIRHVVNDAGTPAKPGEQIDIYVFSLFNENRKPGLESERNWGLFYPDQTSVYSLDWTGMGNVDIVTGANITSSNGTWCVASSNASDADLQNALNWACGSGNVDCSAIQPSQPCYQPDTLASHASYAFNSFYQLNGATDVACNFGGTGVKTIKDPSYDACVYSTSSKMGTGNSTTSAALTSSSALLMSEIAISGLSWSLMVVKSSLVGDPLSNTTVAVRTL
ncbi:hypothetical protein ZIOFF_059257 [Zingiber officinale]|uniref:glucan endo-1,3-beta-D-glucosidase n=1 Tax=Zingiber officinale TaxID=94328 RepID=A0A8J5F940_ZINOF|nr:hypothetical protein ZIOFF_059257 [Zingiber officinale]